MPRISKEACYQGGHAATPAAPDADRDWSVPCTAAELQARVLPYPDQSRYGTATTDPLGREGAGWHHGKNGLPVRTTTKGDTNR